MVTYLTALRFAANVEAQLDRQQRRIFSGTHDASARFLPPLIPLHWSAHEIELRYLEDIRREHSIRIVGVKGAAPGAVPPGIITLAPGDGEWHLDVLADRLAAAAPDGTKAAPDGPTAAPDGPTAAADGAAAPGALDHRGRDQGGKYHSGRAGILTARPRGGIVLAWTGLQSGASPIDLPGTAAFFLSHIEIVESDQPAWWDGATWRELFRRRLANPGKERRS
jgi:hypothetical protein